MIEEKKRSMLYGLPLTFTKYTVDNEILTEISGFFTKRESPCYLYKITDVEHKSSMMERLYGLGTVICYTGDTTHGVLTLKHIKNSKEMYNILLNTSEEQRLRRRTLNMQTINHDVADWG